MTRLLLFFLTITCSYQLACCQSPVFQIGTKWVYEVGMGYDPVAVAPLVYELTGREVQSGTTEDGVFQLTQPGLYYLVLYTQKQPEVLKLILR